MSSIERNMPIHPLTYDNHDNSFEGLTKREWLAGQALAGLASDYRLTKEVMAELAVKLADLTLEELAKWNTE